MSQRRYELTDFEWSVIEPLLPNKPRGVPRVDDRRVLNGIYWRLRTGSPWTDIPERYGPEPRATIALCAGASWAFGTASSRRSRPLTTVTCNPSIPHPSRSTNTLATSGGPKKGVPRLPAWHDPAPSAWGVREED